MSGRGTKEGSSASNTVFHALPWLEKLPAKVGVVVVVVAKMDEKAVTFIQTF